MDVVPYIFRSCQLCGIWYEDSSNKIPRKLLYSTFVAFVMIYFTLSELIEVARMRNSLDDVSEVLFVGFNYVSVCLKILNFTSRQVEMRSLLDDFRQPLYRPRSPAEEAIAARYSDFISKMFLGYVGASLTGGCVLSVATPLLAGGGFQMPYRAYHPFNVSERAYFGVAYSLQFLATIYGIVISVSLDAMACGFMILTTGQVELNCRRIVDSSIGLKKCVEHQVLLLNTVYKIQEFFIPAVVPLFFFSMITFCTTIFRLSQMPATSIEFLSIVMYLSCMSFQVFLYCWFGNELELKNQELTNAVYSSNWTNYEEKEKKHLWFIMLSTKHATRISYHGQCGLTLNTFIWITKTSYAAFNVLSQAKN